MYTFWNSVLVGSKIGGNFVVQVETNIARFAISWQEKDQKSSDKAEYHSNEGEGKEKLNGLKSGPGSNMFSNDWQYLSLGYLEQSEFFFTKLRIKD